MEKLTGREACVYDALEDFVKEHGYAPTIRELCEILGTNSTSTMHGHLRVLEFKGYIKRNDRARTIVLIKG